MGAAEARENTSKKGSRACYCKWCEVMVADTYRGRSVAAGWRGRKIGRGRSRRRICTDRGGERIVSQKQPDMRAALEVS